MPRSKSSVTHRARTKKIFKQSKGYYGHRKNVLSVAKQSVFRSGMFAFAHRRKKKGDYRVLWQIRISAALKELGLFPYSKLIHYMKSAQILLDRKALAFLAVNDLQGFKQVALTAQESSSVGEGASPVTQTNTESNKEKLS